MISRVKKERVYCYISTGCVDARDVNLKLIDGIVRCGMCGGNGKCQQNYCDAPSMTGKCDCCEGMGFRYSHGDFGHAMPFSVVNQIALANGYEVSGGGWNGLDWKVAGPKVWNRREKGKPADAIYIGRGSPWGNPFRIGVNGDRDAVCEQFKCEVLPKLDVSMLRGKHLVCFCAPLRCHGDDLLKKANE